MVSVKVTLFSEKMLIFTRCKHGFMPNLIKKSVMVSITYIYCIDRNSASVSRGLQVEEDDLIQFNNGQKASLANGSVNGSAGSAALSAVAAGAAVSISTSASVAQLKKQLRSRLSLDQDDDLEADEDEVSEEEEETASEHRQTADENMDYLEGLEPCPCYAKCCLDSLISLFCVTVLG